MSYLQNKSHIPAPGDTPQNLLMHKKTVLPGTYKKVANHFRQHGHQLNNMHGTPPHYRKARQLKVSNILENPYYILWYNLLGSYEVYENVDSKSRENIKINTTIHLAIIGGTIMMDTFPLYTIAQLALFMINEFRPITWSIPKEMQ